MTLGVFVVLAVAVYNFGTAVFVYYNSHFREEDLDAMWLARVLPFTSFIVEPIDEHFAPLHRLIAYVLDAIAPMNFGLALAALCGFQAIGLIYLYRILRLIECYRVDREHISRATKPDNGSISKSRFLLSSPISWLLFGLCGSYVYVGVLFLWWTAGLHRLPLFACEMIAIYYFLRYRQARGWASLAICSVAVVAGFGFFTKAVLVPIYLLALELCFWSSADNRERRKNLAFVASLVGMSLFYVAAWKLLQPQYRQEIQIDPAFQLGLIERSWGMLRDSAAGSIYNETRGFSLPVLATTAAWVTMVAYTVAKRRSNTLVWCGLSMLLLLNVLLTGLSKLRIELFGFALATLLHRYYYELAVLVVIGAAIAFKRARVERHAISPVPPSATSNAKARWQTLVTISILAGVMLNSYKNSTDLMADYYGKHRKTREFMLRLQADARRILAAGQRPLRIIDEPLPEAAGTKGARKASFLFEVLDFEVEPAAPGPGVYRISESGSLISSEGG
ncbi:MAG TPA: hypothetical protein VI072_28890 [Polyangiaceae bacterium]